MWMAFVNMPFGYERIIKMDMCMYKITFEICNFKHLKIVCLFFILIKVIQGEIKKHAVFVFI